MGVRGEGQGDVMSHFLNEERIKMESKRQRRKKKGGVEEGHPENR